MSPKAIALILVAVILRNGETKVCCPETSEEPINDGFCADGSILALDCQRRGMFILSPETDYYRLEGDKLKIPNANSELVLVTSNFCTGYHILQNKKQNVVIVCFEDADNKGPSKEVVKIYSICLMISDIFLVITFLVYCFFPKLRDLQGKCVMCFIASLFTAYFSLSVMQLSFLGIEVSNDWCIFSGFFTYYWLLCVFFWLNIVSFNIWRSTSPAKKWPAKILWLVYLMYGFGGPTVLLIIALITHHIPGDHIKPNFTEMICWFPGNVETWVFMYGPMSVLLISNITFFVLTAIHLWKDYKMSAPQPRIRVLRYKWLLYLKLFLVMGISWIFEIISSLFYSDWFQITDILNCLQGFVIFIVMIVTRKKVIRAVANSALCTRYCSFCPPNTRWQTMEDDESLENGNEEQIQLS